MRTIVFQDTKRALRLWNIQCILAGEESQMTETLLHAGPCGPRAPSLKTPPSGDLEQHDFFDHFSRSDVGALWCVHMCVYIVCVRVCFPPQHVGLKRFRKLKNSSVLGLVSFVVVFSFVFPQEESYQRRAAQGWERLRPVPSGRFSGAVFRCVTVKGRVTQYLWVSRNFAFLWCLSNGSSHFYNFPQIRKTV